MKKILVIDDEVELVNTIKTVLTQRGYKILCANDGESGLETALREQPDLVITDLNMPNMDGWRVCQRIKESRENGVPVIMLSALVETSSSPSNEEIGDSYLGKPFAMKELLAEIQRLLPES